MQKQNILIISLLVLLTGVFSLISFKLYKNQQKIYRHLISGEKLVPILEETATGPENQFEEKLVTVIEPWAEIRSGFKDCVVQIFCHAGEFNWLEPYKSPTQREGAGSGFFIDDKGHIVTNAHVVNQAKAITLQIPALGKERLDVEIVGICFDRDIALLKISAEDLDKIKKAVGKIPYLKLGNSDKISGGSEIMVLGYPLGQQCLKSTKGVVSGRERQLIQIDAPINPGNSGGPVVNVNGEVIGIASSGILEAQNVGYIIQVNELKVVLGSLLNPPSSKLVRKPFLGVFYNIGSDSLSKYLGNPQGGCYITGVYKDSLLDKVGIKSGDVIFEVNGNKVDFYGEIKLPGSDDKISLTDYISFLPLDKDINLAVYRDSARKDFNFKFTQSKLPKIRLMHPDYERIDFEVFAGLVVMELARNHTPYLLMAAPDLIKYEEAKNQTEPVLVVTHVLADSQASRSRILAPGTLITQVNGNDVKTLQEYRKAIRNSMDSGFFTIKTSNDIFAVFDLKKVVQDEMRLPKIYRYPLSNVVEELIKRYTEQNEKKQ
ncbi:MAG: trypsin-like peptidase domain-containing protein [Candidatus Babeliales bacterium]|nr:trypsin-like peptidase domain-containing protein [Candidatus Babeliales bacterium]